MACCTCDASFNERCSACCPCFAMYPSICSVFFSLLVAAILSSTFGAYCFISIRQSIFSFQWSPAWFFITNVSFLALIAAAFLAVLAVTTWCVCQSYRAAIVYKLIYTLILLFVILLLAACMVCSILIMYSANRKDTIFARELERVWLLEIQDPNSTLPCRIQKQLVCHGMETGDCQRGSPTINAFRCGTRCRPEDIDGKPKFDITRLPGCRERIAYYYVLWHALLLGGASASFVLLLVAFFVTCTNVSFEKEN